MRIHFWPALVCGWIVAAMTGQTVHAADPTHEHSEVASLPIDVDDSDLDGDAMDSEDSSGIPSAFRPMQYADGDFMAGMEGDALHE